MNIKLWISLALSGCLGSCVVIDERYINYHINTTESLTSQHSVNTQLPPTTPVPPSTIEITIPETQLQSNRTRGTIRCEPFSLPTREKLPGVPDFTQSEVELELQIANYINSLYATIHRERQAIDLAIAEHLKSCSE